MTAGSETADFVALSLNEKVSDVKREGENVIHFSRNGERYTLVLYYAK